MRKRKYVKISVDMFDNRKLKLIENMKERDIIEIIWIKLLLEASKTNNGGLIYLEEDIPYTASMLSIVLGRSEEEVELALKVLVELKMIEIDKNNFIKVCSWSSHNESKRNNKTIPKENNISDEELDKEKVVNVKNKEVCFNKRTSNISAVKRRSPKKKKNVEVIRMNDEKIEENIEIIEFKDNYEGPPGNIIETFTF